ncbi:MAG: glycosyltransferase [Ignavibacteria bacterium]|nr:MAG: glycosyltransferase [Ignavibacteria bacterium]
MKEIRLSLSMIVRDEEKNIVRCLDSVKEIVDEIVIVDTGSNDKTIELAESCGARVYNFPWVEDFSAARNFGISKCSGKFILYLDADETLSAESIPVISKILDQESSKAYSCILRNLTLENEREYTGRYCRFFPNKEGIKFTGKVHEQIEPSLIELNIPVETSNIEIIHHGYAEEFSVLKRKAERNLAILNSEFEASPNYYVAYQLGLTHSLLGNKEEAYHYFIRALNYPEIPKEYRYISTEFLVNYYLQRGDLVSAKAFLDRLFEIDPSVPSSYLLASKIYAAERNFDKALMYAASCYEFNSIYNINNDKLINVKLDPLEILFHGLHLSAYVQDPRYLNHFSSLLKKVSPSPVLDIIEKIRIQERLSGDDIAHIINDTKDNEVDVILVLLRNYIHTEIKQSVLEFLYKRFENNPNLLIQYSDTLFAKGNQEEAIDLLEHRFADFSDNPAPAFYLISYYIEKSDFHKLELPLKFLEDNFSNDAEVISGLQKINEQIKIILN